MTRALLTGAALVCFVQSANAQGDSTVPPPAIPSGATVRITAQRLFASRLEGKFARSDSSGIELAVTKAGSIVRVPWSNVSAMQWRIGRDHLRGAGEGALVGLILGASVFSGKYGNTQNRPPRAEMNRDALIMLGIIPATTAAIGGAVGVHHWQAMPVPSSSGGGVSIDFHPNDDVRVESTLGTVVGRAAFVSPDSLRMTTSAGPFSLPLRNVGDLQVRGGKRRVRGAFIGAAIAFGIHVIGESVLEPTTTERIAFAGFGAFLGARYLSPPGWISLPQPRR